MYVRDFSESCYYWVWSRNGPSDEGLQYGRTFRDGRLPWPVPGDIALQLDAMMYRTRKAEPMEMFHHWEQDGSEWSPVFKRVEFVGDKPKRGRPRKQKKLAEVQVSEDGR